MLPNFYENNVLFIEILILIKIFQFFFHMLTLEQLFKQMLLNFFKKILNIKEDCLELLQNIKFKNKSKNFFNSFEF